MRKLLMAALISGILFFMPAAEAEIETYIGVGNATMNETENQEQVINRAKGYALRNASEQAGVYVVSQSKMRDLELVEDEVVSITGGLMKITDTKVEKSLLGGDVLQVRVTVTVQIDSEALQREIDRRIENKRPKTPIDRPKPIEQPKPKPVEQPKPPVEQPKPPAPTVEPPAPTVEPPAPTVEPIEPTTPIEPITPPVNEPSGTWLTDEQILTSDLLELINAEREKAGKTPLKRNSVLVKGAKQRAEELTRKWSDKRPNGQGWWTVLPVSFQQKASWEYIHSGYDTPQKIVDWYMSQSDNRILSSNYTAIGIGYFYKADSDKKHYWVVILS
ncbi:MAG: hypothetical protein IKP64_11115 [Selenomonadaceae bacterium]|nr:hypothetical protein [Selenomonadaceae bacterium]MBR4384092.1 hypothetical protein [Selenomonadaceae bacterium]